MDTRIREEERGETNVPILSPLPNITFTVIAFPVSSAMYRSTSDDFKCLAAAKRRVLHMKQMLVVSVEFYKVGPQRLDL